MEIPKPLHRWDVAPTEAIKIQRELSRRVIQETRLQKIRYVAGADLSIAPGGRNCGAATYVSGIVIWDCEKRDIVEKQTTSGTLTFPYVPGLLSFREVPAILGTLGRVHRTPDLIMCDGQGYAHPRRFGLACHVGVLLDLPTVGCAKSRLCGTHGELDEKRGAQTPVIDGDEIIGLALRTRDRVKPLFVSVGNKVDLQAAADLVLSCTAGFRLPEPTRQAHKLVYGEMKRMLEQLSTQNTGQSLT